MNRKEIIIRLRAEIVEIKRRLKVQGFSWILKDNRGLDKGKKDEPV